jgi:hypothetical protein
MKGMIDSYRFGEITIDGVRYSTDLIILPSRIRENWWRREGHRLCIEDLDEILEERPEILVVGTGYSGLMRVPREVIDRLREGGIEVIVQRTLEAWKTYNRLLSEGRRVAAAFHLTC